jgi:DNA processing protein
MAAGLSNILSASELVDWIRLIRSDNIGPRTFRQLIYRFGSASAAIEALPALIAHAHSGRAIRIADRDEALREIEASSAMGVRFVAIGDPAYPAHLRMIDSAPPLLGARGDISLLQRSYIAIVGSRNASSAGLTMTEILARGLGREGYAIASGLARGIDTVAHRASLEGGTIAVLAGGHAKPYPSDNLRLLEQIVQSGGVALSEMPLEWEPRGRDFPRRNRIVSGLSLGVVVVEAARRSGSLITARFALDQGREVFAVPGSPLDPRAAGANDLLKEGATLCACVEDIISGLSTARKRGPAPGADLFSEGPSSMDDEPLFNELDLSLLQERVAAGPNAPTALKLATPSQEKESPPTFHPVVADARERLLSLLSPAPVPLDELIRAAGLPAREVHSLLCDLDLEGLVERHGGSLVSLMTHAERP